MIHGGGLSRGLSLSLSWAFLPAVALRFKFQGSGVRIQVFASNFWVQESKFKILFWHSDSDAWSRKMGGSGSLIKKWKV